MSSRSTSLEPKSQLTINPALERKQKKKKKKVPDQRSEESKRRKFPIKYWGKEKKKENSQSNIGGKQKRKKISDQRSEENKTKYIERSLDQTISEQYRIVTSKQEKERKPQLEMVPSL